MSFRIHKRDHKAYRKIYVQHYGPIPYDDEGRTYEIHHIDGNPKNNDPVNLLAVSMQEHYEIHESQCDWYACLKIASKMKMSAAERSDISRKAALKRLENGDHQFLNMDWQNQKSKLSVENGTHNWQGDGELQRQLNQSRIENGTHNFLGGELQRQLSETRVSNGTHHFMKRSDGTSLATDRISEGTHPWQNKEAASQRTLKRLENGTHPSQTKRSCEHCGQSVSLTTYGRWHGNKCKHNTL